MPVPITDCIEAFPCHAGDRPIVWNKITPKILILILKRLEETRDLCRVMCRRQRKQ